MDERTDGRVVEWMYGPDYSTTILERKPTGWPRERDPRPRTSTASKGPDGDDEASQDRPSWPEGRTRPAFGFALSSGM